MRSSPLPWLLSLALLFLACGPRSFRSPLEPLERAAEAVQGGSADAEELALAAWHAWLIRGDGTEAQKLVERSLERSKEAWSLLLQAELAVRAAEPERQVEALLALLEVDEAPLDRVAARRLGRLVGISKTLDLKLASRIEALLKRRISGEAAAELRGILVELASHRDPERALSWAREAGRLQTFALVGPLSPHSFLEFQRAWPELEVGPLEGGYERVFRVPTGSVDLVDLPRHGDIYYALAVVDAPRRDTYLVRAETDRGTSANVFIDGKKILGRRAFGGPEPTRLTAEVELDAGEHLLALRIGRGRGAGRLKLEIAKADGSPSPLKFRAATAGDRARPRGTRILRSPSSGARALAQELAAEAGILGGWIGADYAVESDPEAAKLLLESLARALPETSALHRLRARALLADPSLPAKEGKDRAASLLALALRDDEDRAARLALARLHRGEGRWSEAEEALGEIEGLSAEIERIRLLRDRGFDGLFQSRVKALIAQNPERCDALELAYTAARRARSVEARRTYLEALEDCPGGWRRSIRAAKDEGELEKARELVERLSLLVPDSLELGALRAEIELAAGNPRKAAEVLEDLEATWPEIARLPRNRAQYLVAAGEEELAREARLRALQIDGSDLALLRAEAYERRQSILAERDPDARDAIAAFEARGEKYDAPGVILIDFVGIQVNADGSLIERTHVLAKILDKRGIDLLGEVRIPDGAEILELRTIKADGRILEPERLDAKDSISFPGLEVGDYVEYQYLLGRARRSAALEGWASPRFFFASRDLPMVDSLFVVRADKSLGLEVDAHQNPPRGEIVDEGSQLVFTARGRDLPAHIPEPGAVSMLEVVPWVQVGSGAGERELACHLADRLLGASWKDREVERWAREATWRAKTPTEMIESLWVRLMEEIEGSGPFEASASHILARGRGNRAVLLKAALDALGIENAWVVLRPFDRDPRPQRFPDPSRLSKLVLVARPDPAGGWLWLDPAIRHAPLGSVSPEARGVQGFVLGRGMGEAACVPTTSPLAAEDGRILAYRISVQEDGSIEGEAVERFAGFSAARARHTLERLDAERLHQVVEASLARELRGAELLEADVELGEEVALSYSFRLDGGLEPHGKDGFLLGLEFLRMHLAQRFLTGAERKSPLLLAQDEHLVVEAEILLPPGFRLLESPPALLENSEHGSYRRSVGEKDGNLVIRDVLELRRGRILPHEYPGFAAWLTAVDSGQMADLLLERVEPAPPPSGEKTEGDFGVEVEAEIGAGDLASPSLQ